MNDRVVIDLGGRRRWDCLKCEAEMKWLGEGLTWMRVLACEAEMKVT